MATRRKFLGILGVGAASAPLAAKEALDGEVSKLAGIGKNGWLSSGEGIAEAAEEASHFHGPKKAMDSLPLASDYLRKFNSLPDHVERRIRDSAKEVHYLDYDIANKRSWSLAVKVMTQRERNYEREVNRYREGSSYAVEQKAFEAITGFKWPW